METPAHSGDRRYRPCGHLPKRSGRWRPVAEALSDAEDNSRPMYGIVRTRRSMGIDPSSCRYQASSRPGGPSSCQGELLESKRSRAPEAMMDLEGAQR